MVTRIMQDRYGFMWFATLDGLNRYDGYKFTIYRNDEQDSTSITESFPQALFEDSKGRLWIGTMAGGLDLFNRKTESFTHFRHNENDPNSLIQGPIESIWEDREGNIWVHIADRLEKLIIRNQSVLSPGDVVIRHFSPPVISPASIFTVTRSGYIYFADAIKGIIYKLDRQTNKWSVSLDLSDHSTKKTQGPDLHHRIVKLMEDTAQGKLYVIHDRGISVFDEGLKNLEKFFSDNVFSNMNAQIQASMDKQGSAWLSGHGRLYVFNNQSGKVAPARARDSVQSRILRHTYSTYVDRSGLLWIGTSGYGILKRNIRSENFHHTGYASEYSIKEAADGKIIIGNNIVVREIFDRATGKLTDLTEGGKRIGDAVTFDAFLSPPVMADNSGAWFAESDRLRYDNKQSGSGFYVNLPVTSKRDFNELIQCSIKDSAATIWLGTTEGLLNFRPADRKWQIFRNRLKDSSSITSNVIFSLCLDPKQPNRYLWVGTNGRGLNRLDMTTGTFSSYTTEDGLPNNVIYGILRDDDGNLWMSTNKGLSSFNPSNQSFKNFDYKDGLQSNEFNRGAYYRTKDGCLFFGGVNGFNYFYPREIRNNITVPQVMITGLKVRNSNVSVRDRDSVLQTAIYLTKQLTLPYEQNFLSFEFAALDFTNSEKNLYKYILEGIDKNWINSNHNRSVTYTNLRPGTYTLRVKGSNSDGTWNETGTSMEVTILPPWYMTWWFRITVTLLTLFAGYAFYNYRLKQALKLQAIRDRIGSDLHDEVGSNLSNIFIFSNVAQQKAISVEETGPLLQKITDYTQQSMEAMDDIVWMINARNDRFENIMIRMRTLAAEFAETCGCTLHLDLDEKLNNVKLNMEARKNFYLIYKEAINNTAKYASCSAVWIKTSLNHNIVSLEISDNGRGFDMADAGKGNGIGNMKKRAELLKGSLTINSTPGGGTSLYLSFKV